MLCYIHVLYDPQAAYSAIYSDMSSLMSYTGADVRARKTKVCMILLHGDWGMR